MRKYTALLLFTPFLSFVNAQEVVSTQGDSYTNGTGSIDFTIGEVVINTVTDGTNDLTQGFHQTNWNFVELEDVDPTYEASVYPNPTEEVLNIQTSAFEEVSYTLYDANGKLVLQDQLSAEITTVQVDKLAPGSYSMTLHKSDSDRILKIFKLVKHTK